MTTTGVGYQFGLAGARDVEISLSLALAFSIVISLIADLERGYKRSLQVNQQPMIDRKLGAAAL